MTVAELVKLVKRSAKGRIVDEEDLDTYYRKFWIIVADLVEADVINKKQHNKYFWKGLSLKLWYAISDCLEVQDANFESDQVPEAKKAIETGYFVLRKVATREGWSRISRKGKRERRGDLSDNESEEEVIRVETGLDSDSEKDKRRKKNLQKGR